MEKEQEKALKAREAALKGALMQIDKQFGAGSIMKMGDDSMRVQVAAIPTGAGCRADASSRCSGRSRPERRR